MTTRPQARLRAVSETHPAATGRPPEFAECRSMGHTWRHHKPIGIDDRTHHRRPFGMSTGMVGLPSRCSTCGTERVRWVTRSGEVVTRYEHPDGYSRHGDERLTSAEWRRSYVGAIFADYLDHDTPAAATA